MTHDPARLFKPKDFDAMRRDLHGEIEVKKLSREATPAMRQAAYDRFKFGRGTAGRIWAAMWDAAP